MTLGEPEHQDIRSLQYCHRQPDAPTVGHRDAVARLLGNTRFNPEISLVRMASHDPRNTAQAH